MNFPFRRKSNISPVFDTSKVYCVCVLDVYDFFHKSGAFFTSIRQIKKPVLGRYAIAISSKLTS